MKKILSIIMTLIISVTTVLSVFAETKVSVIFEGEPMTFDVEPFIEGDRTLVPMRAIFEAAGATISWDGETQTVIVTYSVNDEAKFMVLQIGNENAFVGDETIALDVPAKIVNDRTFVPLRFVMETLGREVTWDPDTYTVDIK